MVFIISFNSLYFIYLFSATIVNSLNPNQRPQNVKEPVNPRDGHLSTFHLDFNNLDVWYKIIHIILSELKVYDTIIDMPPDEPSTLS